MGVSSVLRDVNSKQHSSHSRLSKRNTRQLLCSDQLVPETNNCYHIAVRTGCNRIQTGASSRRYSSTWLVLTPSQLLAWPTKDLWPIAGKRGQRAVAHASLQWNSASTRRRRYQHFLKIYLCCWQVMTWSVSIQTVPAAYHCKMEGGSEQGRLAVTSQTKGRVTESLRMVYYYYPSE